MNSKKQIEEMTYAIHRAEVDFVKERVKCIEQDLDFPYATKAQYQAQFLLSDGYRKTSDVVAEVLADVMFAISKIVSEHIESDNSLTEAEVDIIHALTELKKKYISEDTNVTTKESEKNNE